MFTTSTFSNNYNEKQICLIHYLENRVKAGKNFFKSKYIARGPDSHHGRWGQIWGFSQKHARSSQLRDTLLKQHHLADHNLPGITGYTRPFLNLVSEWNVTFTMKGINRSNQPYSPDYQICRCTKNPISSGFCLLLLNSLKYPVVLRKPEIRISPDNHRTPENPRSF